MPATIVGELTADRTSVVLIAIGADWEVANASRALQVLTPLCKVTDPPGALRMPATWPAVVQLAAVFGAYWRPGPVLAAWLVDQVRRRTALGDQLCTRPPNGKVPRAYQVAGALMIASTGRALLFDDPGTGKTITTILGLVERWAQTELHAPVTPIVVVAPSSVVDPWVKEFSEWAPQWRVRAWRGSPQRRRNLAGTADVYVTSYGTARRDAADTNARTSPLIALRPATVVADEVHMIKHQASAQSRAVRRLASGAAHFVGLSGTPITHSPADLWPSLVALEPGAWPSGERWVQRYCTSIGGDYRSTAIGLNPETESEFRTTLLGRHRRVSKADVLAELPPKVYSVRTVDLPAAYRTAYDGLEQDMLAQMPDGAELSVMTVLTQLGRLAQLASAAADIQTTTEIVEDPETGLPIERVHQTVTLKAPSWKVDALLEVLDERPGQPVVAFAPSRQLIMLAAAAATSAGMRVGHIVGGQTPRERTAQRESFQRGELDLLCVTTGAGGVGLTLTAARTAVFLQRPWSLVEAMQAEDRLHRIGAERHESIEVIDIVARKTIDSRVRKILRERAGQLSDLVQDPRIVAELLGGPGDGEQRTTKRKVAA
jgi:SNF2 family DNA or RNA helicase